MKLRFLRFVLLTLCATLTFSSISTATTAVPLAPTDMTNVLPSGQVLSDEELGEIHGDWLPVSVGIGVAAHVVQNGWEPDSADWWLGLGGSVALALIPMSGASVAAKALSGSSSTLMSAYGAVVTAVTSFGPGWSE